MSSFLPLVGFRFATVCASGTAAAVFYDRAFRVPTLAHGCGTHLKLIGLSLTRFSRSNKLQFPAAHDVLLDAVVRKGGRTMRYWLMKTEPDTFGVDDLAAAPRATTSWDRRS